MGRQPGQGEPRLRVDGHVVDMVTEEDGRITASAELRGDAAQTFATAIEDGAAGTGELTGEVLESVPNEHGGRTITRLRVTGLTIRLARFRAACSIQGRPG